MAAEPFVHVMLIYSLKEQRLIHQKIFEDEPDKPGQAIKRAMDAYMDAERDIGSDDVEIVLVGADSLSDHQDHPSVVLRRRRTRLGHRPHHPGTH